MQTYTRGYCRQDQREGRFRFAGYATGDAHENTVRPRAYYQSCCSCGLGILTLGGHLDVPDALGLCLAVLVEFKRRLAARVSGDGRFDSDVRFDEGNVLGELHGYIWHLYNRWNPLHGAGTGTFRGYATGILRQKIKTFVARDTGDVAGGRKVPKAHSQSVSTSLQGLQESIEEQHGTAGLEVAFGVSLVDDEGEPRVPWAQLSDSSRHTIRDVVTQLNAGWSPVEVEAELGYRPGTVSRLMNGLRREIEQLEQSTA